MPKVILDGETMRLNLLIAFALLSLRPFASHAGEAIGPNQWVILGIGSDSCASYVLALNDHRPTAAIELQGKTYFTVAAAYTQWLTGYVTALNLRGESGPGQITVDVNGVALWVKRWCEERPSLTVVDGISAFYHAHRPKTGPR